MVRKIVINGSFGGYGLSKKAYDFLGLTWTEDNERWGSGRAYDGDRENPDLVKCIETLGDEASGSSAHLYVYEFDDEDGDFDYYIDEYDGAEDVEIVGILSIEKIKKYVNDDKKLLAYFKKLRIRVKERGEE